MKAQAGRGSTGGRSKASYDLPKYNGGKVSKAVQKRLADNNKSKQPKKGR